MGREHVRIIPDPSLESVKTIGDVAIESIRSDRQLFVRDVATITRDYQDPPGPIVRLNGERAIGIGISSVSGGNVVVMGEAINRRIAELKERLPVGLELGTIYFQPEIVVTAINGFVVSLLQAVAIVVGCLLIAMGVRSGLLIGAGLLLTILGTFILMSIYGVALERISLGALVIALSMMVDNAIVVVEGQLVGMERGGSPEEVAKETVAKTTWPLLGGTAVAVLAFAAIGLSQDATGEYCFSLFLVILFSLGVSWILAVTVTPLLGAMFLKAAPAKSGAKDPYGGLLYRSYRGLLAACLRFPLGHAGLDGRAPRALDLRVRLRAPELFPGLDHPAVHGRLLGPRRHGHPQDVRRPRADRAEGLEARRREGSGDQRGAGRPPVPF